VKLLSKAFAPLWAHSAADGGISGYSIIGTAVKSYRQWLEGVRQLWKIQVSNKTALKTGRTVVGNNSKGSNSTISNPLGSVLNASATNACGGNSSNPVQRLVSRFLTWTSESQAAKMRKETAKNLMYGGGKKPIFALIGFTLASNKDGILTQKDKMETVCQDIRIAISSMRYEGQPELDETAQDVYTLSLQDLQLGGVIAKGCNAVVHFARWRVNDEGVGRKRSESERSCDSGTESSIEVLSSEEDGTDGQPANLPPPCSSTKDPASVSDLCTPFNGYDLAVKMMFNYDAESNAPAILRAMYKEIVPARAMIIDPQTEMWDNGNRFRKKNFPPHPNIVDLKYMFADSVPHLPQAMSLYPDALPKRLNRDGVGRNMTLFLVMKRYHCSLQDYLKMYSPPETTCLLLLAQLFEGIAHMTRHLVVHRDLKADNILLDLSDGPDWPQLVITDFGCCLADDTFGLKLPYYTEETAKGGNSALMAPEVACVRAGPYVNIDYSKSDLWAAASLAYEILGVPNPFYRSGKTGARLDSRTYSEGELPALPEKAHPILACLIRDILKRDPHDRPDADVAANVCEILLFGPPEWRNPSIGKPLGEANIMHWLVTFAAQTICQEMPSEKRSNVKYVERQLTLSFLRRSKLNSLSDSMKYFHSA